MQNLQNYFIECHKDKNDKLVLSVLSVCLWLPFLYDLRPAVCLQALASRPAKGHRKITFPGLFDDGAVGAQQMVVICPNSASRCFLLRNSLLPEIQCSYMQNEGFGQENP